MANQEACPICNDPLGASAVTVSVAGVRHRVCCDDCAKEAAAHPARLKGVPAPATGR